MSSDTNHVSSDALLTQLSFISHLIAALPFKICCLLTRCLLAQTPYPCRDFKPHVGMPKQIHRHLDGSPKNIQEPSKSIRIHTGSSEKEIGGRVGRLDDHWKHLAEMLGKTVRGSQSRGRACGLPHNGTASELAERLATHVAEEELLRSVVTLQNIRKQ